MARVMCSVRPTKLITTKKVRRRFRVCFNWFRTLVFERVFALPAASAHTHSQMHAHTHLRTHVRTRNRFYFQNFSTSVYASCSDMQMSLFSFACVISFLSILPFVSFLKRIDLFCFVYHFAFSFFVFFFFCFFSPFNSRFLNDFSMTR